MEKDDIRYALQRLLNNEIPDVERCLKREELDRAKRKIRDVEDAVRRIMNSI